MSSGAQLEAADLYLDYMDGTIPIAALANVSLVLRPGEFLAIVGPSGCGKTSLIRLLGGLIRPTHGAVRFGSRVVEQPSQEIGVIFQQNTIFPWFTVGGNVEFALRSRLKDRSDRRHSSHILLDSVGLSEFESAWPGTLSGGMSQRLTLARAIATQPLVLLLDEPFSSLDAISRTEMHAVLLRIWQERGISILLVTHDLDEAVTLADRVLIMSRRPGTIAAEVKADLPRPRIEKGVRIPGFDVVRNRIAGMAVDLYRAAAGTGQSTTSVVVADEPIIRS